MSAGAACWAHHTVVDAARDREASASFDVLVRRRPRVTSTVVTGIAKAGAAGSPDTVEECDNLKMSHILDPAGEPVSPGIPTNRDTRSLAPMGSPELRPCDREAAAPVASTVSAPATAFGDLSSVKAMGTGRAGIVVGFDTEFTTTGGVRVIDSYQFATPDPLDPALMVEVVILPGCGQRVSLHTALWAVVEAAELWRSPLVPEEVGPRGVARSVFWSDDWEERREALAKLRVPLVLACHYGSADLTTFRLDGHCDVDHMTRLTSAAGGLVTLLPFRMQRGNDNGHWWQSLSVSVRDTMSHAPAGQKSLAVLGKACSVPKIDVPDGWIADMTSYRREHLSDFLEYGINDSVIVVEYLARLWGDGVVPPITLSGGAATALVHTGIDYLGVSTSKEFRRVFAGLVTEDEGVDAVEEEDRLSFYAKRNRNPIDGAAKQVMSAFASAYHGGLNSCPMPGYYPLPTVDIDAQNAYPTAMALVEDIDWEAGSIENVVHERKLTLEDVPSPTTPFAGFVSFEFAADVLHPCLPIVADGTLIYPRTSEGVAGSWACGPELWLALRLGASVFCQIGYTCRRLAGPDDGRSLALRHGVKQLIDDRNTAKDIFGKGSIEEKTLKTGVNSVYGKTAQDVAEQRAWNAREQEMDGVGGSGITSPYHAAMTTSLVRAQLLATMNEISTLGGSCYSVTTDGFITDFDEDEVNSLGLYGLADVLRESREALTGDPTIWEAKHAQSDLVNFTTRGNVSQHLGGVCAHNGLKAPKNVAPDSAEDREYLLRAVVTRGGRVPNGYTRFPSFKELSRREGRKDFIPSRVERSVSMDYDLKRRPVMDSMTAEFVPLSDGTTHEIATFTTEPWERVEDSLRARRIAREMAQTGCLRTVAEWSDWYVRFAHGKGHRIVTTERSKLMSIVMAHRQGVVVIPTLADKSLTVQERLYWLAEWGLGTVSRGDWDNARRPERASQMLPVDLLNPYLDRMVSIASGEHPTDADRRPY